MSVAKYAIWQTECAPTTGQLHVQAAVRFTDPIRMGAVKTLFPGAHLEVAIKWETLKEYCKKEDTRVAGPWEHGRDDGQGRRSDLAEVGGMVVDGKSDAEIALLHPSVFVRYHKGLAALRMATRKPQAGPRRCALFVGRTGTGKTRLVFDSVSDVYTVFDIKTPWFDGYCGESTVLFDECGPGMFCMNQLKRWTDRYPERVPVKGGCASWDAKCVILTSNTDLEDWYPNISKVDLAALKRRIRVFRFPDDRKLARAWLTRSLQVSDVVKVEDEEEISNSIPVVFDVPSESDVEDLGALVAEPVDLLDFY